MTTGLALDEGRLATFRRRLLASPRRRVPLPDLWRTFADAFPGRPQEIEERSWLSDALTKLAGEGAVRFPASKRNWDRAFGIPLPRWIEVRTQAPPPRPSIWRSFPWHPSLQWISDLRSLDPREEEFLRRVHEGLVASAFTTQAPIKLRSLQLLGHEKALQEIFDGRLFAAGRLDLVLLGCLADVPPVAWASVGDSAVMLVLENADAFTVARAALRNVSGCAYGMVAFGDGSRFERSVKYLRTIERVIERIDYVGDIDGAGIVIAERAGRTALAAGLPPLQPAPGFHRAMFNAAAALGSPNGWPAPPGRRGDTAGLPTAHTAFMPEDVRDEVGRLLRAGRRIPEEVLGPEQFVRLAVQRTR